MRPAVFLMILLLCACKDRVQDDFDHAYALYEPVHVAGVDTHLR